MKTTALLPVTSSVQTRLSDYLELTKPRIAVLVLFTVAVGALLGAKGWPHGLVLLNTLIGTALVAAGASALNQFLERHTDGLMRRTENRPLPSGRLQPLEVLIFGTLLSVGGLIYLALAVRHELAVLIAGITLISYVFLYTPLKRKTTLNTLVGAVPGALPPVIGWTAMTGTLDAPVIILFLIVFLWQIPHFLSIAWIYREDYSRAGLLMLPVVDPQGGITGRQMVSYSLALLPVSLSPILWQQAGIFYASGALLLGLSFSWAALGFAREKSNSQARRVLHASLLYLPLLFALLLLENMLGAPALALP
jgi:protoheme IX farnesyltransferase